MSHDKRVTIYGAGITGLTAAHELAERGFSVTVIEKRPAPFSDDCEIGGMARTQWSVIPYKETSRRTEPIAALGEALGGPIPFDRGEYLLNEQATKKLDDLAKRLDAYAQTWTNSENKEMHLVLVQGYASEAEARGFKLDVAHRPKFESQEDEKWFDIAISDAKRGQEASEDRGAETPAKILSRLRATMVAARIYQRVGVPFGERRPDKLVPGVVLVPVGLGGLQEPFDEGYGEPRVTFSLQERQFPGEHGYRYFPGFYRHVFDTMRRTAVFERGAPTREESERAIAAKEFWNELATQPLPSFDIESAKTVFDNLVPTTSFAISTGRDRAPAHIPRVRPRSLREVRRLVRFACDDLGMTPGDIVAFELKILKFMTSCSERRAQYEEVTWWDYLGAEGYSDAFKEMVDRWPQALIGIRAKLADARTIGTVSIQLLLDQLGSSGFRDGTLNGPTSVAWFDPWKRYLKQRKVAFRRGTATKADLFKDPGGYVILAVPLPEAKRLIDELWDGATEDERKGFSASIRALHDWDIPASAPDGSLPIPDLPGPLRLYSGIQFYLSEDLGPADGHLFFADSDFRLSAISQAQFWRQRVLREADTTNTADFLGDHVSVLSVDIGDWYSPSLAIPLAIAGKCASELTKEELAEEVWRQIEESIRRRGWDPPDPKVSHIDDDVIYGPTSKLPEKNHAPYLVNMAGDWKKRPGDLSEDRYDIYQGLVLAGTYMKTHTRLVTMESANESGRRAANAVLHDYAERAKVPVPLASPVWDPEDYEIDDLDSLKDIDRDLVARGLPHLLEILDVEGLVTGAGATLSPEGLVDGAMGALGATVPTFASRAGIPLEVLRRVLGVLLG